MVWVGFNISMMLGFGFGGCIGFESMAGPRDGNLYPICGYPV